MVLSDDDAGLRVRVAAGSRVLVSELGSVLCVLLLPMVLCALLEPLLKGVDLIG